MEDDFNDGFNNGEKSKGRRKSTTAKASTRNVENDDPWILRSNIVKGDWKTCARPLYHGSDMLRFGHLTRSTAIKYSKRHRHMPL